MEATGLTRLDTLRALRWANWDAALFTVYVGFTGGAFQTGFARQLGASDLWLGIMTALPALVGSLQVFAAYLAERAPSRRSFVLKWTLGMRAPWLLIALIPLMAISLPRLELFIGLITLSAVLGAVAGPAFLAWLSDLIPADYRGRYFGKRNMILGLVAAFTALPPALFLDQAVKHDRFSPQIAFAVLFGVGAVFMFLSYFALSRMPEAPRGPMAGGGWSEFARFYREPFQDRNFKRMLRFIGFWTAGHTFAGQFFTVYQLEELKLPYIWIQGLGVITAVFSALGMPFWGYLSDKYGNKPLLAIAGGVVVFLPLLWILTTPEKPGMSLGILIGIQIMAGLFWAGVNLSQFNMILGMAPDGQRTVYMGAVAAVGSLVGGIAPALCGAMMEGLQGLLPTEERYHVLFVTLTAIRLFGLFWLRPLVEPRSSAAGYVLGQLTSSVRPRGWRAARRLSRGTDEETRVEAAKTLAEARTPLAVEELVRALQDPSPDVRRHAAIALGEIGDVRAVAPLIEAVNDPASDIAIEAIEALGGIGDASAVDLMLGLLEHESMAIRVAAARAVQTMASPEAIPKLLMRLRSASEPDEQRAILRAVTELAARRPESVPADRTLALTLIAALSADSGEVRADAAEALGRLAVAEADAPLREKLAIEPHDRALAAMASALASRRDENDAGLILSSLARADSDIARRRIALAVAVIWGIDQRLYPMLTADEMSLGRLVERAVEPYVRNSAEARQGLEAFAEGRYSDAARSFVAIVPDHPLAPYLDSIKGDWEVALLAVAALR